MSTTVLYQPSAPAANNKRLLLCWPKEFEQAPIKSREDVFTSLPDELVELALQKLRLAGIQLIEWRSMLYKRMGVPLLIKDYYYLIPDNDLERAGEIVSELGVPSISPPSVLVKTSGDFYSLGRHFRLTRSSSPYKIQMLILFPLSFTNFLPSELQPVSILYRDVLIPRPPAVFASIMRTMAKYPRWSPTRTTLECDLSELIGYHLYELHGGYVDPDDDALCEKLQVDKRIRDAGMLVKKWRCEGDWREAEEWMNDALYHIVVGEGDLHFLPWAPAL